MNAQRRQNLVLDVCLDKSKYGKDCEALPRLRGPCASHPLIEGLKHQARRYGVFGQKPCHNTLRETSFLIVLRYMRIHSRNATFVCTVLCLSLTGRGNRLCRIKAHPRSSQTHPRSESPQYCTTIKLGAGSKHRHKMIMMEAILSQPEGCCSQKDPMTQTHTPVSRTLLTTCRAPWIHSRLS